jgi:hypothetical protein
MKWRRKAISIKAEGMLSRHVGCGCLFLYARMASAT